ncbi:MAG: hypothetical protein GY822_24475 [Deltaproteobacteria bacterium]|nr:hypothetical protein [Deltaproteobacteria bacterium]
METQMLDDDGRVEKEHRLSHLVTPLTQHPLLPGRAHLIRFRFAWPGHFAQLHLRARLFTRKMVRIKNEASTEELPVHLRMHSHDDKGLNKQLAYARYLLAAAADWEDARAQQAINHLAEHEIESDLTGARFLIERLHHYDETAYLLEGKNDERALFLRAKALAFGGHSKDAAAKEANRHHVHELVMAKGSSKTIR